MSNPTRRPVVYVIPCGAAKTDHPAPAAALYTGAHFRYTLARVQADAAKVTDRPVAVFILSALHGLVPLDRIVDPYDVKMGDPGCITADRVAAQAAVGGWWIADVYAFLPAAYFRVLDDALKMLGVYALDGYEASPGIGYQRGTLAHIGT